MGVQPQVFLQLATDYTLLPVACLTLPAIRLVQHFFGHNPGFSDGYVLPYCAAHNFPYLHLTQVFLRFFLSLGKNSSIVSPNKLKENCLSHYPSPCQKSLCNQVGENF